MGNRRSAKDKLHNANACGELKNEETNSKIPHTFRTTLLQLDNVCCAIVHPYLNFNVVSANSANTSAIIQNRAITLDSDQPISSKW